MFCHTSAYNLPYIVLSFPSLDVVVSGFRKIRYIKVVMNVRKLGHGYGVSKNSNMYEPLHNSTKALAVTLLLTLTKITLHICICN